MQKSISMKHKKGKIQRNFIFTTVLQEMKYNTHPQKRNKILSNLKPQSI